MSLLCVLDGEMDDASGLESVGEGGIQRGNRAGSVDTVFFTSTNTHDLP